MHPDASRITQESRCPNGPKSTIRASPAACADERANEQLRPEWSSPVTPLIVLILIVCAIIGALIGDRSGHRINGFFFGLLLGPVGVAIVALWKPRRGRL
jgi:hypothetical protein